MGKTLKATQVLNFRFTGERDHLLRCRQALGGA
jgi:hypothetical protein